MAAISFAINKHGWENFEIIILEKYVVWDQQLLDSREQYFIRFYDSFKNGYNSNEGGNCCKRRPWSEEQMAKRSKPVTSCEIKKSYANGTQLVKFVRYASQSEAERQTRVQTGLVSKCCLKKAKSGGGRYWFFTHENHPPEIIKVGTIRVPRIGDVPKPCLRRKLFSESPSGEKQLHKGNLAAGRTLSALTGNKFEPTNISKCCLKKRTYHHGYKFWYASDEEIKEFNKEASKKRKRK